MGIRFVEAMSEFCLILKKACADSQADRVWFLSHTYRSM